MREILFRGKRRDNEEWVYGYYLKCVDSEIDYIVTHIEESIYNNELDRCLLLEIIPETVGQYIGLKDIEGNEIFEGDIVEVTVVYPDSSRFFHHTYEPYNDLIVFDDNCFMGAKAGKMYPFTELYDIDELTREERKFQAKVIGNKWDNPELLKEK